MTGERAVASEALRLAARIDSLKAQVRTARDAGAGKEPDPQAKAIAQLAGIDAGQVRAALAWLLALVVEAISAFGLFAITRRADSLRLPWRLTSRDAPQHRIRHWRPLSHPPANLNPSP